MGLRFWPRWVTCRTVAYSKRYPSLLITSCGDSGARQWQESFKELQITNTWFYPPGVRLRLHLKHLPVKNGKTCRQVRDPSLSCVWDYQHILGSTRGENVNVFGRWDFSTEYRGRHLNTLPCCFWLPFSIVQNDIYFFPREAWKPPQPWRSVQFCPMFFFKTISTYHQAFQPF